VPANIQQYQFTSIKVNRYRLTIETATAVEDYKVYANMHNKNEILQKMKTANPLFTSSPI